MRAQLGPGTVLLPRDRGRHGGPPEEEDTPVLLGAGIDRTLIWNQRHLLHALREFEEHYNEHQPHRALDQAALRPAPEPITDPDRIARLDIRRHDRLGGAIHEYRHAS
jgi:hypothetical protein